MKLSHNNRLITLNYYVFLISAFLFFEHTNILAKNSDEWLFLKDYREVLATFSPEKHKHNKNALIALEHWDAYLSKHFHGTNSMYLLALSELANGYGHAFSQLELCIQDVADKEKKYSSKWIDVFLKNLKKKTVRKNRASIGAIIWALHMKNSEKCCIRFKEKAIYQETLCREGYKKYMERFFMFYKNSDKNTQKKFEEHYNASSLFMKAIETPPIAAVIGDSGLTLALAYAGVVERSDPKLFELLSNVPDLQMPFLLIKAFDELNEFCK